MPQITLAKALKLKNRLAGRLAKVQQDVQRNNSVLVEQKDKVDIKKLDELRLQIVKELISLKTAIVDGNQEIQRDLITMGEAKSELTYLASIPVRDGVERHGYQNTEVTFVATITKAEIDQRTKTLESEIDKTQDKIDEYNHTKKIEVSQLALDLAS